MINFARRVHPMATRAAGKNPYLGWVLTAIAGVESGRAAEHVFDSTLERMAGAIRRHDAYSVPCESLFHHSEAFVAGDSRLTLYLIYMDFGIQCAMVRSSNACYVGEVGEALRASWPAVAVACEAHSWCSASLEWLAGPVWQVCHYHDLLYWFQPVGRREADRMMRELMKKIGALRGAPVIGWISAWWRWAALRALGWACWKT